MGMDITRLLSGYKITFTFYFNSFLLLYYTIKNIDFYDYINTDYNSLVILL